VASPFASCAQGGRYEVALDHDSRYFSRRGRGADDRPGPDPARRNLDEPSHRSRFGEPVTTLAVGDGDSFQIERHEDKVFIKPLQQGVSTNLFVWTASRELSYELDPSGSLSSMDVLIRTDPRRIRAPMRTPLRNYLSRRFTR